MKNKKLLSGLFNYSSSDHRTLIALLAGMAAGAALGILFAPERGKESRRKIFNWTAGDEAEAETGMEDTQVHRNVNVIKKKPKSDIGSLIHQAHTGVHTEQGLS